MRNDVLTEPHGGHRVRGRPVADVQALAGRLREEVSLKLVADTPTTAGALALGPPPTPNLPRDQTISDTPSLSETNAISNPTTVTANRRVFLSAPLEAPVHISGTPVVRIRASANATDTNLGAILVDYGARHAGLADRRRARTLTTEDCWGEASLATKPVTCRSRSGPDRHPVARLEGHPRRAEPQLLRDRRAAGPRTGGVVHVPPPAAGLRLPGRAQDRLVLVGSYSGYGSQADQNRATISLNVTETLHRRSSAARRRSPGRPRESDACRHDRDPGRGAREQASARAT